MLMRQVRQRKLNPHEAAHWSYEGETGPMQWGKMNAANNKCDLGERQSPIDIRDGIKGRSRHY